MNNDIHILVIDDDARLRELLQKFLTEEGFRVTTAANANDARRRMLSFNFDLLVVDVMMPDENGLEFTKSLRVLNSVPILMLTAMGETEARIKGLQAGADDYLTKPFEPRELVLRIQSILKRLQIPPAIETPAVIMMGHMRFDTSREILLKGDQPVRLTTTEVHLLKSLSNEPGRIMSREELTNLCQIEGGDRSVDVQVTRLRRKIEIDPKVPRYLHTVRGRGYVLRPD